MEGEIRDAGQQSTAVTDPRFRDLTDSEVEAIAEVCHEANRVYQYQNQEEVSPAWEEAPDWQRSSAMNGVRAVLGGGKYQKHPAFGPSDEETQHNNWMEEKLRAGWTYGEKKDAAAKTHPCLLPYASLPDWQRRKDHLFRAICLALDPRRTE